MESLLGHSNANMNATCFVVSHQVPVLRHGSDRMENVVVVFAGQNDADCRT